MVIRIEMLKIRSIVPRLLASFLLMFVSGLSHAADTNKGATIYAMHCATCHGVSGISVMPNAPNFAKNEGLMNPDRTLLITIQSGKAAMPAYRGVLSDQDILNVIAYLRTLN
jgi:cytochrome c6